MNVPGVHITLYNKQRNVDDISIYFLFLWDFVILRFVNLKKKNAGLKLKKCNMLKN